MVNIKEKRDSATEKLKKSGCEVEYLGFSFKENSVEETYRIRREGKDHIASIEHRPNGSNLQYLLVVSSPTSQMKKDVTDAFQ